MYSIAKMYSVSCEMFLRRKAMNYTPDAPLQSLPMLAAILETFFIYLVGPLPKTSMNHVYVLTVTDYIIHPLLLIPLVDAKVGPFSKAFV